SSRPKQSVPGWSSIHFVLEQLSCRANDAGFAVPENDWRHSLSRIRSQAERLAAWPKSVGCFNVHWYSRGRNFSEGCPLNDQCHFEAGSARSANRWPGLSANISVPERGCDQR